MFGLNKAARAVLESRMALTFAPGSDGFRRIYDEGLDRGMQQGMQQGMQHATRVLLRLRYQDPQLLDELLDRCATADLEWLEEQILTTPDPLALREALIQRLAP